MTDRWEDLKSNARTGADLSPGDPVAAWAVAEIERLRTENNQLRELLDDAQSGFIPGCGFDIEWRARRDALLGE